MDRALCLHEAAHAVTAEVLRPGCVTGIVMYYQPGTPDAFSGQVFGSGVDAVCSWRLWSNPDPNLWIAIAAGREGELIEPDECRYDFGDREVLKQLASAPQRARARRKARSLVKKHSLAIRRVAKGLRENRTLTGDEIRALIG